MRTFMVRRDGADEWEEVEAVSVYDAVTQHIKGSWLPSDDDVIEYEAKDDRGVEWTATVDIEMEPHFDVMCERKLHSARGAGKG